MEELVKQMDYMVLQGQIPQAVERFFAEDAHTKDVDGSETNTKSEAVSKLTGFAGSIKEVKEIKLISRGCKDNDSFSEFHFHFGMADGSEIDWHEVIKRTWQNGLVVDETYFQN